MTKTKIKFLILIEIILVAYFLGTLTTTIRNAKATNIRPVKDKKVIEQVAKNYLEVATYSKYSLVDALCEYEHFDRTATNEVVDSLDVDWQKQADEEVKAYLKMDGNSEKRIRDFLKRDKFSRVQIDLAIEHASPDWDEQAEMRADILREAGAKNIFADLISRGFTPDQARNAAGS